VDAQGAWVADTLYAGVENLSTLRLRAGLSQKEFGVLCGLNQSHVSRYESGKHEPGVMLAKKMAIALDVTLDNLVEALENTMGKEIV